jgi:hypothetical protein
MEGQQPHGRRDLTERIKEWEKELKYHMKEIGGSLLAIAIDAKKKANLPKIEKLIAPINLYCDDISNNHCYKFDISTEIYPKNENRGVICESNIPSLPDKLICANYIDKSLFELPNLSDDLSYIKNKFLDAYKTAYREVLMTPDNQPINIKINIDATAYMYFDKPVKEPPVIIKYNNLLIYDEGNFYFIMSWLPYNSS